MVYGQMSRLTCVCVRLPLQLRPLMVSTVRTHKNSPEYSDIERFNSKDPYVILGVQRHDKQEHIKDIYEELTKNYHPAVCADDPYNRYDKVIEAYKEISFTQGEHQRKRSELNAKLDQRVHRQLLSYLIGFGAASAFIGYQYVIRKREFKERFAKIREEKMKEFEEEQEVIKKANAIKKANLEIQS